MITSDYDHALITTTDIAAIIDYLQPKLRYAALGTCNPFEVLIAAVKLLDAEDSDTIRQALAEAQEDLSYPWDGEA